MKEGRLTEKPLCVMQYKSTAPQTTPSNMTIKLNQQLSKTTKSNRPNNRTAVLDCITFS